MTVLADIVVSPPDRRATVGAEFRRTMTTLRHLDANAPRVYAVADMAEQSKRRWWSFATGCESGRFAALHGRALLDHPDPHRAIEQVSAALVHAVVGRSAAAFVACARSWDPGPENLWIHLDSDVCVDWAGVRDTTLRSVSSASVGRSSGTVGLPCDEALAAWIAHRASRSLDVAAQGLSTLGPIDRTGLGRIVGDSVLGASARVPMLGTDHDQEAGWRRGQMLLDALAGAGWQVRRRRYP
ncbi:hypothetical protein ASG56_20265 [Rhodococcus sp. Leaf7]|uniref:hypothetical protein n=1 Tax=unclassified Rhodococcus (in: high G+C Gram-positive bacteria) TaxID=192944 RepID=UPI0006FB836B|nr:MULTISPECIES: hypothetical protein [unclassified Rhodococcus (in: high G+C Gram-positive bacteria)]KQU03120.1 hypothetical protein ASG56_20265 [Rhodococcus sp. Leaf7]KQU38921.1 hypothetical protein ASG64_17750 [Rhodococcus sp. Leaf247]